MSVQTKDDGTVMATVVAITETENHLFFVIIHVLEKPWLGHYRKMVFADLPKYKVGELIKISRFSKALEGSPLCTRMVI
jgi:hypothetical protein